jgi:proline dehydrogenase
VIKTNVTNATETEPLLAEKPAPTAERESRIPANAGDQSAGVVVSAPTSIWRRHLLREFFIALSTNRSLRHFAENNPLGQRMSKRFVAGNDVSDGVEVTRELNKRGIAVTIDNLGENVTNVEEARHSSKLYHQMIDELTTRSLNCNVSLKLTHMGMDVDEKLCRDIVSDLVDHAARVNSFVRVDMEGSPYTQQTLDLVHDLHSRPGHQGRVGTVIQAYLYRSEKDVQELLCKGIRIRLCKGAYKEPADIAFQEKSDVDKNYVKLAQMLLKSGIYHGIATHDEAIINQLKDFAVRERIARDAFEFQMLYGIRRDLQEQLVKDGWRMRVYVPFGTEWYPYFMRRLAERPANALFIAKNLLRK